MSRVRRAKDLHSGGGFLDETDIRLLVLLDANARLSMRELAEAIGMSPPSASERVKRLENAGIIKGFRLDVDGAGLGYPIQAMVRIKPIPGQLSQVEALIAETRQFVECERLTGDDPLLARLVAHSIEEMDEVLKTLLDHAVTSTAIIKSSSVKRRLPPL